LTRELTRYDGGVDKGFFGLYNNQIMAIEEKIIKYAKEADPFRVQDLVKHFKNEYTRQYLSQKVGELVEAGELLSSGTGTRIRYTHKSKRDLFTKEFEKTYKNKNLSEEKIMEEVRQEALFKDNLNENIQSILEYALSEMINNAIEHSESKSIKVKLLRDDKTISFFVIDYGVGVFKNVMRKLKLNSEYDAINEILKGKTTTQPKAHSGEGIFFTSKISDKFHINSKGFKLIVDNEINDVFVNTTKKSFLGSEIYFQIKTNSKKHLSNIFKEYQSNPNTYAFDKTKITVKLYTLGTIYMSRSQARRILSNLDKFDHIILDFKDVPTIGQAFADEIFRVYKDSRPNVKIDTINTNDNIDFMIGRVG
jgi:anti-sigma regulatory factor (Ser/Thr protein kinase)